MQAVGGAGCTFAEVSNVGRFVHDGVKWRGLFRFVRSEVTTDGLHVVILDGRRNRAFEESLFGDDAVDRRRFVICNKTINENLGFFRFRELCVGFHRMSVLNGTMCIRDDGNISIQWPIRNST
jgi:hypothetical protein